VVWSESRRWPRAASACQTTLIPPHGQNPLITFGQKLRLNFNRDGDVLRRAQPGQRRPT
jgi:hypothetical protein